MLTGLLNIFYYEEDESVSCPVMSNSLWPHGLEPTRLLCPWDSSGRNIGVGCHFLLQMIFPTQGWMHAVAVAKSHQSCPTLCDPTNGSPPGSPVPGILQARTLEWVAISISNAWKWKVKVKSLSLVRLSHSLDCSPPGSSIHGILFQARVLEWVAIAFSRWMDRYIIKVSMKKLRFTFDNHLQNGKKIRKLGSFFHIK